MAKFYEAIGPLQNKGAVLVDESSTRLFMKRRRATIARKPFGDPDRRPPTVAGRVAVGPARGRAWRGQRSGEGVRSNGSCGARVLLNSRGKDVMRRDLGQEVVHVIWTGSTFLSWMVHVSVGAGFILTEITTRLEARVSGDDLKAVLSRAAHREPQSTDHDLPVELRIGIDAILRSCHPTVPGYQLMFA